MNRGVDYLYVECDCGSPDHLLRFYRELEDDMIGLSLQMSHYLPWWRRAAVAVKYLFGHNERCHFSDAILDESDRARVAAFLTATKAEQPTS